MFKKYLYLEYLQYQIHVLSHHDVILWYTKIVFLKLLNYSQIEAATFCCRSLHLISLLPILGQSYVLNFLDKRPKDLHGSAGRWDGYLNSILSIAQYVPGIGSAVITVQITLNTIRPTFNTALSRVQTVDDKIYPYKDKCDTGATYCNTGEWDVKKLTIYLGIYLLLVSGDFGSV